MGLGGRNLLKYFELRAAGAASAPQVRRRRNDWGWFRKAIADCGLRIASVNPSGEVLKRNPHSAIALLSTGASP